MFSGLPSSSKEHALTDYRDNKYNYLNIFKIDKLKCGAFMRRSAIHKGLTFHKKQQSITIRFSPYRLQQVV